MAIAQIKRNKRTMEFAWQNGLTTEDLVPVLEAVDSIEDLKAAVSDPSGFLKKLVSAMGPDVGKRMAIAQIKRNKRTMEFAWQNGLTTEDLVPVLEAVDSIEDLKAAVSDPSGVLKKLSSAMGPDVG